MSDSNNFEPTYKSSLPELHLPPDGFQSQLPAHLMANESPAMQWMMNEMSKSAQAAEFACRAAVVHNEHLRQLNGRTAKNEERILETKASLDSFKQEAAGAALLSKPITSFLYLWQSHIFKIIFALGVFTLIGVAYPYYIEKPGKTVVSWVKSWLGHD